MSEFYNVDYQTLRAAQGTDNPPLLWMRRAADYIGPNYQENFGQAVNSPGNLDLWIREAIEYLGLKSLGESNAYDTVIAFTRWVVHHIGHGDDGCGNWGSWAMMTIFANFETAKDILSLIQPQLPMNPQGIHTELADMIKGSFRHNIAGQLHFTAAAIPELHLGCGVLSIDWPYKSGRIGEAPTDIEVIQTFPLPASDIVYRK